MSFLSSKWFLALRVVASVALIAFIVTRADLARVLETLRDVDVPLAAIGFVVMTANVSVGAWRWWELLRIHGIPKRYPDLARWYYIAQFFNNFLPTSIGGDGFRVYRTYDRRRYRSTAFLAVFVERLTGLATLLALGWLCAGRLLASEGDAFSRTVFLGGAAVGVLAFAALGALAWLFRRYGRGRPRLPGVVENVLAHARDYAAHPRATLRMLAGAFVFHVSAVFWMWCLARSIGEDIPFAALFVVAAMTNVVSVLPLSINGIGLVDGAFIYLAGLYGMGHEPALTFVLLQRAMVLVISVLGAALYAVDRRAGAPAPDAGALELAPEAAAGPPRGP